MTQRQPKGSPKGGQFAPDTSGKNPPATGASKASVTSSPAATPKSTPDPVKLAHDAYAKGQAAAAPAYERPAPVRNGHQFAPEGECSYCDQQYEEGNSFFPPHRKERKTNCGGGSNFHHCTCSACF